VSLLVVLTSKADIPHSSCRLGGSANTLQYILPDFSRNRHGFVRGKATPTFTPTLNLGRGDAIEIDQCAVSKPGPGPLERVTATAGRDGSMSYDDPPPSDSDQILYMSNERFTVPELLFNPSDIGEHFTFHKR